jgi:hypothetical protein
VQVSIFNGLTVPASATLTAPAWNGTTGGILAFIDNGTTTIAGTVTMAGNGFRGQNDSSICEQNGSPWCNNGNLDTGPEILSGQGESALGLGAASNLNNGAGGGGGVGGQDCGQGGGGAYGAAGTVGINYASHTCAMLKDPNNDSAPGAVAGNANLATSILFGGAGGEGGWDEDGAYPGPGGNGGGIIFAMSRQLVVTGNIVADGSVGGNGSNTPTGTCAAGGSGMGGGGGGAGGAVYVISPNATLGTGLVTANGGNGGLCSGGEPTGGGPGGVGRVDVIGATSTGTTVPPAT